MKFSHFAYRPSANINGSFAYDIPVYRRIHRHPAH